jgi:hypothetical protein
MSTLRLVTSIASSHTKRVAKVYRNSEWDEYQVKYYRNGIYQSEADSFTDDKDDAVGTAEHFILH